LHGSAPLARAGQQRRLAGLRSDGQQVHPNQQGEHDEQRQALPGALGAEQLAWTRQPSHADLADLARGIAPGYGDDSAEPMIDLISWPTCCRPEEGHNPSILESAAGVFP
jgi:hypothetical protein